MPRSQLSINRVRKSGYIKFKDILSIVQQNHRGRKVNFRQKTSLRIYRDMVIIREFESAQFIQNTVNIMV